MTFELKWITERRKAPVGLSLLTVYVSLADLDPDLDLATSVPFGAYGASTVTRSTL